VQFSITVPAPSAIARRPNYVSSATKSATISVTPGAAATSVNCTTVCSGSISAPVGTDTFTVNLYDGLNGSGNLLSTGTAPQTIVSGQANTVTLTFNGVVAGLAINFNSNPVIINSVASTMGLTVVALDADGKTIVGPGNYSDANGNLLTVTIRDSDASGATQVTPTTFTAPGGNSISLVYNGMPLNSAPTITASGTGPGMPAAQFTPQLYPGPVLVTGIFTVNVGQTQTLTVSEVGYSGTFAFTTAPFGEPSSCGQVINGSLAAIAGISSNGTPGSFTLSGINAGSCGYVVTGGNGPNGPDAANLSVTVVGTPGPPTPTPTFTPSIAEFPTSSSSSAPYDITVGSDGNLWFTELNVGKIGRITTAGVVTEFSTSASNSDPQYITSGPDGNLWFTENSAIARITPTGTITEFPTPTNNSSPFIIVTGADGNLWFTELNANKIGRITTSGTITEFATPLGGSAPFGITAGSDGNLWFTELNGGIGRITTSGAITEFATPSGGKPYLITSGPDGNLWFTENVGKIGRATTSGTITEFATSTSGTASFITTGPDGNLWFGDSGTGRIGKITTSGTISEYGPISGLMLPHFNGMTTGSDGNLWFPDTGSKIGRITTTGTITDFATPSNSGGGSITNGPDNNLWFTESGGKIGKLILH
jgi:streptogramin lyase